MGLRYDQIDQIVINIPKPTQRLFIHVFMASQLFHKAI